MRLKGIGLVVLLAALPAGAQDFIRYYPPAGVSGLTDNGTSITSSVPIVTPSGTVSSLSAAYSKRTYDNIVVVSTTISAAIAGISTATYANRYLVYVPDGTYTEEITMKDWVDVVGESRTGVILTSDSAASHTVDMSNVNAMLSTMTVRHTANAKYAIHADSNGGWTVIDPTVEGIVYNVTAESSGTNPAIGVGLWSRQRFYLITSSFSATANDAAYIHNSATQPLPVQAVLVDVTASSPTNSGFVWHNIGSGRADYVSIVGGTFSGKGDAGNEDIVVENSGAGAGEAYISIDSGASYSTISLVDAAKRLTLPTEASMPALPQFTTPGVAWTADGYLKVDTRVTTAQLMIGAIGYVDAGFGTDFRLQSFIAFYPITADATTLGKSGQGFSNSFIDRSIQGMKLKALTESSATAIWDCALAAGAHTGGTLNYCVYATDATDFQERCASIRVAAVNKAGTTTCGVATVTGNTTVNETTDANAAALSAGTLTYAVTCSDTTNSFAVSVNAVSSLAQSTLQSESRWDILTVAACTPQ